MRLGRLMQSENHKSAKRGERKKRLGTLVDLLANWWIAETGRSIAPYVKAKRLDHRSAFVVGRSGPFLSLALAMFGEIDQFKESEIIWAVTKASKSNGAKRKTETKRA